MKAARPRARRGTRTTHRSNSSRATVTIPVVANPPPAQTLVFDLLSTIFDEYHKEETPAFPLENLLLVCRHWKTVAEHHAPLWTNYLVLSEDFFFWDAMLARRLSRSPADSLLDIQLVNVDGIGDRYFSRSAMRMFDFILDEFTGPKGKIARRWKRFTFLGVMNFDLSAFIRYPTPNLEHFEISGAYTENKILPRAPLLRTFSARDVDAERKLYPHLGQVTTLTLSNVLGLSRLLSTAVNVEDLTLFLEGEDEAVSARLPKLKHLTLGMAIGEGFLEGLECPNLQSLSLILPSETDAFDYVGSCPGMPLAQVTTLELNLEGTFGNFDRDDEDPKLPETRRSILALFAHMIGLQVLRFANQGTAQMILALLSRIPKETQSDRQVSLEFDEKKGLFARGDDRAASIERFREETGIPEEGDWEKVAKVLMER